MLRCYGAKRPARNKARGERMGDIMDRKRTWQFALALALPLIIGAGIYFSTNQTVEITSGHIAGAIPLWAAAAALIATLGLLIGGEIDRAGEVRRLNKAIAFERITAASPTRDAQAKALGTHVQADVGLIERRLTLDAGLDARANVVFYEVKDGQEVNVNSRRKITFVYVAMPENPVTVAVIRDAIKASYPDLRPRIVDSDGNDLHGNSKIKNL
jgi:hypothetical protein